MVNASPFVLLQLLLSWFFLGKLPSTTDHLSCYTFTEPLERLQNGHDILLFITSMEHEQPIPVETNQVLDALCTEPKVLLLGVAQWHESSIPNPDEVMVYHVAECTDKLDTTHLLYHSF